MKVFTIHNGKTIACPYQSSGGIIYKDGKIYIPEKTEDPNIKIPTKQQNLYDPKQK